MVLAWDGQKKVAELTRSHFVACYYLLPAIKQESHEGCRRFRSSCFRPGL